MSDSTASATSDQIKAATTALSTALKGLTGPASLKANPTGFVKNAVGSALPGFTSDQFTQLGTELVALLAMNPKSAKAQLVAAKSGSSASGSTGRTISGSSDLIPPSDLPYLLQCPQNCFACIVGILLACIALGCIAGAADLASKLGQSIQLGQPDLSLGRDAMWVFDIGFVTGLFAAFALYVCSEADDPRCV